LRANLAEINKLDGVTGYILRNSTSAIIDLKEPAKLVNYAILSSLALDSGQEFSELFNLGNIENVLIEGKDEKVLCFATGENKVSIFMEKDAHHKDIRKQILPKAPKY
jgi:predicted regulator of Ras-like GTPase activity (Roadblock/LC7/MglB family)